MSQQKTVKDIKPKKSDQELAREQVKSEFPDMQAKDVEVVVNYLVKRKEIQKRNNDAKKTQRRLAVIAQKQKELEEEAEKIKKTAKGSDNQPSEYLD